jgi:uncharacterized protein YcbX
MHISSLYIYPVKSLRGFAVDVAEVDSLGIVGDRRFLVVDETDRFMTQRQHPRMAQIVTELTRSELVLRADGVSPIAVARAGNSASKRVVSIWRSHGLEADDCGDDVSRWLSDFLRTTCRLVRVGRGFRRPVLQKQVRGLTPTITPETPTIEGRIVTSDLVHFADGYPFLAISEASLDALNDRLVSNGEEPVSMDRFRPNLVIRGALPHAEDTWPRMQVGNIVLRAGGPCGRCIVTTTDQLTGERGKEPLRTLATYRRGTEDASDVNFGQNFINETKSGSIRVGDPVVGIVSPH